MPAWWPSSLGACPATPATSSCKVGPCSVCRGVPHHHYTLCGIVLGIFMPVNSQLAWNMPHLMSLALYGAVAAAQAQQQGNQNILPLMHSLAHFMPQMAVPGAAHSMPQAPGMMMPQQQPTAAVPHAASSLPPGFPSFLLAPSSAGVAPMPWQMVSQPPASAYHPPLQQAAPAAAPAMAPVQAHPAPAAALQAAQPAAPAAAAAPAQVPQAGAASGQAAGGAFSALLQGTPQAPVVPAQQQIEQPLSLPQLGQDPAAAQDDAANPV